MKHIKPITAESSISELGQMLCEMFGTCETKGKDTCDGIEIGDDICID
jgi:hypothetical protein